MGRLRDAFILLALLVPAPALADPSCFGLCSVACVKPIAINDRWDDFSVPGATNWSGNGVWDSETFTDSNGNGIYDPGEPFQDGSSMYTRAGAGPINGKYDAETYDPLSTGYEASKDLGSEVTLALPGASPAQAPCFAMFIPNPYATGAGEYRWNWESCNPTPVSVGDKLAVEAGDERGPTAQAARDLINQDPGAYWDPGCNCVVSSFGDDSPRLIIITAIDPRDLLTPGSLSVHVTKLIAFFLESADNLGHLTGRFAQIHRSGDNSCTNGGDFIVDCAVATRPTTWGALKASYR
jgi:hypothetical protein